MTRFAVITDTHANLPALEATLAVIEALDCAAIYHTGDAVGTGPYPMEVLDRLLHTPNMHFVMGNHDELCAFGIPEPQPEWMDERLAANARWTHDQVGADFRSAMTSWPYELVETWSGQNFAFLHYPRDPGDSGFVSIMLEPDGTDLDRLFDGVQADGIFYGHHHPAADQTGRVRYINPGSLGCGPDSLARFSIVEVDRAGVMTIQHHAVPYDRSVLHAALAQRDLPDHEFLRQAFFE